MMKITIMSALWLRNTSESDPRSYVVTNKGQKKFRGSNFFIKRYSRQSIAPLSQKSWIRIPLKPQNFFGLYFKLLKLLDNWEDHFNLYSLSTVHSYDLYHMHITLSMSVEKKFLGHDNQSPGSPLTYLFPILLYLSRFYYCVNSLTHTISGNLNNHTQVIASHKRYIMAWKALSPRCIVFSSQSAKKLKSEENRYGSE